METEATRHHIEGLMAANRLDEARTACETALLERPTDERVTAYLGMVLLRQGDHERAEGYFRKALCLAPHFWESGLMLARCLHRHGKIDDAYDLVTEMLHVKPDQRDLVLLEKDLKPYYKGRFQSWEKTENLVLKEKLGLI